MYKKITNKEQLKDVLKTYTGSDKVPYNLLYFYRGSGFTKYFAYSRGKNTLLFKGIKDEEIELVDVYNKIKLSSYKNGIDANLLHNIENIISSSVKWLIYNYYSAHIAFEIFSQLSEQQIIDIMKLGFSEMCDYDGTSINFVIS